MSEQPIIIKKKKSHGHAHHGGSWKVAYADFVTAMMAFFMVMWIMGLSEDVKTQIQGYFNDPLGFMKNQPRVKNVFALKGIPQAKAGNERSATNNAAAKSEDNDRVAKGLKDKLTKAIETSGDLKALLKNIEITVTPEGLRIELLESTGAVFFESGRAIIRSEALNLIKDRIAPILAKTGRQMILEGHTDAKPYGGNDYTNWDLSSDRAKALRKALAEGGVEDGQFLEVRGMAATQLRLPSNPFHYSNRRVSILLPFKSGKDEEIDLPKGQMKSEVQGVFRQPLEVVPPPPGIGGNKR